MSQNHTPRKSHQEETDWGRLLKEYMEKPPQEVDHTSLAEEDEEASDKEALDDLEALLRAQLAPRPAEALVPEDTLDSEEGADGLMAGSSAQEPDEDPDGALDDSDDSGDNSGDDSDHHDDLIDDRNEMEPPAEDIPEEPSDEENIDAEMLQDGQTDHAVMEDGRYNDQETDIPDTLDREIIDETTEIEAETGAGVQPETENEITVTQPLDQLNQEEDNDHKEEASEEPTSEEESEESPEPTPAPDDALNGMGVSSLLTSPAFLNGLDEVTRAKVLTILQEDNKEAAASADNDKAPEELSYLVTATPPAQMPPSSSNMTASPVSVPQEATTTAARGVMDAMGNSSLKDTIGNSSLKNTIGNCSLEDATCNGSLKNDTDDRQLQGDKDSANATARRTVSSENIPRSSAGTFVVSDHRFQAPEEDTSANTHISVVSAEEASLADDDVPDIEDPLADVPDLLSMLSKRHPLQRNTVAPGDTPLELMQTGLDTPSHSNESSNNQQEHQAQPDVASAPSGPSEDAADRDTEMLLRLGYEEELRTDADTSERTDRIKNQVLRRAHIGTRNSRPVAYREKEYNGREMTQDVEHTYRRTIRITWARLFVMVLGLMVGLIYDHLPTWSIHIPELSMFTTTVWYPLCGMALLLLFALPCLPRLWWGLRSLYDFEPVRDAVPAMAFLIGLLHHTMAAGAVALHAAGTSTLFVGGVLSIFTLTTLCDLLAAYAEKKSFALVSSGKPGFAMTVTQKVPSSGDRLLTVRRTLHIPDFFAWANHYNGRMGLLNYFLPIALLISLVAGSLTLLWKGDLWTDGVRIFTATYLAALPGSFLLSMVLPLWSANRTLAEHECTVIGEATPDVYIPSARKSHTQMHMADGYALRAISPNIITIRGDQNAMTWRLMACKLFALMDCALAEAEISVSKEDLDSIRVDMAESGEQYIKLYMTDIHTSETVELTAGTHEALTRLGISLPSVHREATYRKTAQAQVMYLAFDRHFRMACAVEYKPQLAFLRAVEQLEKLGCHVSLITYDPLVSQATLKSTDSTQTSVHLIRARQCGELYGTLSSGLLSCAKGLDILRPYLACHKIKKAYTYGAFLSGATLLCAGVTSILSFRMHMDSSIYPLFPLLWQGVSVLLSVVLTLLLVNAKTLQPGESIPRKRPVTRQDKTHGSSPTHTH